jgi:K+ transporter
MRKTKSDAGKEPNPGSQQRCYREDRPMQKPIERVALVTGANRGIGFEIARQLALKKITVLMGARHKERGLVAQNKLADQGLDLDVETTTFYIGREKLVHGDNHQMRKWRANMFIFMSRNATGAASFFNLPADQSIEIGVQLEI